MRVAVRGGMCYTLGDWKGACVGVIDAIADGCFAVARRPYVLIPPVALDLWYWLGERFTPAPLVEAFLRLAAAVQQAQPSPQEAVLTPAQVEAFRAVEGDFNLFWLLTSRGLRTLLPELAPGGVARPWPQGVLDVRAWPLVVLGALALALLGLFCLALYLAGVAQLVRDEPFDLRQLARRAPVYWLRLLGLVAIILGGLVLLGMPLILLLGILTLVGVNVTALLALFFFPLVWLYCYLALAPEAIVVSDVGPLRAIKLSVGIVRRNFWPVIGLLLATLLLTQGFPVLWQVVAGRVAGVPLAIAGNAFLGTGLTAAAMYFYKERLAALEQAPVGGRQSAVDGRQS